MNTHSAEQNNELSEIMPILETAREAVGSIKSSHLNEIKAFNTPPEAIADVLSAVLTLLGIQDHSWLSMKRFLGTSGVTNEILSFDVRRIDGSLRKEVAKLIKKKSKSFEQATIQRASVAAAPLAAWVKANIRYSMVLEQIEPLEKSLQEATYQLEESQQRMQRCQDELNEIDERVAEMKERFSRKIAEAETLKVSLQRVEDTLGKAQNLLGKLSGEKDRWEETALELRQGISLLPVQTLISAGFSIFLSEHPEDIRYAMMSRWIDMAQIDPSLSFSLRKFLSSESELLSWKAKGNLPSDQLSQENAIILASLSAEKTPFIIDPANVSSSWLIHYFSQDPSQPLEVLTAGDERFTNKLELAVRFGKTLLITEVDGIEPLLFPLIRRDLLHQGPKLVVNVGDKQIDFSENFRLILVTRNPSPNLTPDAKASVVQVNFTVTRSGLEGQLLGTTIQHEQPELEKAKTEMLQEEEILKIQIASLEKDLLNELASSSGNILENTTLIESLTLTKEKSAAIQEALTKSSEASKELDLQRESYKPFAQHGSDLFFLIKQLTSVNHMYSFSLASFVHLFKGTLEELSNHEGRQEEEEGKHRSHHDLDDHLQRLNKRLNIKVLHFIGMG